MAVGDGGVKCCWTGSGVIVMLYGGSWWVLMMLNRLIISNNAIGLGATSKMANGAKVSENCAKKRGNQPRLGSPLTLRFHSQAFSDRPLLIINVKPD